MVAPELHGYPKDSRCQSCRVETATSAIVRTVIKDGNHTDSLIGWFCGPCSVRVALTTALNAILADKAEEQDTGKPTANDARTTTVYYDPNRN